MRNVSKTRRCGFTLIELCVVSAVASVLLALTAPALQSSRQDAAAVRCRNNLKQIALALHNYHDVYRRFPAACYARYPEPSETSWMGWQTSLLPFMEQMVLYDRIRVFQRGSNSTAPEWPQDPELANQRVPGLLCPADTTGNRNPMRGGFGTSNYTGNFGSQPFPRWYSGSTESHWPGAIPAAHNPRDVNGLFWLNSAVRIADITDGTSNTILTSERSATSAAGLWIGMRSSQHENDTVTEFSHLSRINRSLTGASSRHRGGINIGIADGSVRFISEDISSNADGSGIIQKLATRNGGELLGAF